MIAFKSSINFFVYFTLKTEFRQRLYEILGCLNVEDIDAVYTQTQPKQERIFDVSARQHSSESCSSASTAPRVAFETVTHTLDKNSSKVANGLDFHTSSLPNQMHPAIAIPIHSS